MLKQQLIVGILAFDPSIHQCIGAIKILKSTQTCMFLDYGRKLKNLQKNPHKLETTHQKVLGPPRIQTGDLVAMVLC